MRGNAYRMATHRVALSIIVAMLVAIPIFLQISGGVFRAPEFGFESGGVLQRLPIPVSVLAVAACIAMLGRFRDAHRSLTTLYCCAFAFVLATVMSTAQPVPSAKLILMAQYLFPMMALVAGEMYGVASDEPLFEIACLIVITALVPVHLVCSWAQGHLMLVPYLYIFSIYQHLEYVPLIMVCSFLMALFGLWDRGRAWRIVLVFLVPWMATYAMASQSAATIMAILGTLLGFTIFRLHAMGRAALVGMVVLMLIPLAIYGVSSRTELAAKYVPQPGVGESGLIAVIPPNLAGRFEHWRFYADGVFASPGEFAFGHATSPDRNLHQSAHNYYLDIAYNFGFLALLPILGLLTYTLSLAYRCRRVLATKPATMGALIATIVLVVIDNSFKVGLRQPYSGIFAFFVWGLLLVRLSSAKGSTSEPTRWLHAAS